MKAQLAYWRLIVKGQRLMVRENLYGNLLLGSESFVEKMQPLLEERAVEKAIPKAERIATRPTLASLFAVRGYTRGYRETKSEDT
ncbi:hypothetical protein M1O14_02245 [Dehalococcoidia bacterium]|nr:hypothetical protein [Dehalococcoidia bacterium]MCL0078068.1 hypothetical protein [Dehalococcoidia bacterium]MCL0082535.1 hypothetical protein [Dehalococcoidia bacterium]MCL0092713.1 hypothetical protein [Dehalococcoidia bacterium]